MKKMWFDLVNKDGSIVPMGVAFKEACLFGWAGRDKEKVMAHAKELADEGIRGPKNVPEYFKMTGDLMTFDSEITIVGDISSGEVEFYWFIHNGEIYVGVGSEHTDRKLETTDFIKSKAICEKPMSKKVWAYKDIKDHWDDITITSWQIKGDEEEKLYQHDPLSALMTLEDLTNEAKKMYKDLEGVIMWSGTISSVGGLVFGDHFRFEMNDPILNRKLEGEYDIKVVPAEVEY